MKVICQIKNYRIIEEIDDISTMEDLKGDSFDIEYFTSEEERLKCEEAFKRSVYEKGVFGYTLEKWNPEIGIGWEHVDSCWGFIGAHNEDNQHYIIDEFKYIINK